MSVILRTTLAALMCVPVVALKGAPVTYQMDASHTFAVLSRSNYGFSNPVIVAGIDQGTVVFDRANPARSFVRVNFPVANLHTFVQQLDLEFRSAMFFDIDKFPNITFESTRVQALGGGRYTISGTLSAHGVTRPVVLHARLNKAGRNPMTRRQAIGFDASATLNRSEFGLGFNVPNVGDAIALKLTMQADANE